MTLPICRDTDKAMRTERHARQVAERMREAGMGRVRHYQCRYCGAWHVGRPNAIKDQMRLEEAKRVAEWLREQERKARGNTTERSCHGNVLPLPSAGMETTREPAAGQVLAALADRLADIRSREEVLTTMNYQTFAWRGLLVRYVVERVDEGPGQPAGIHVVLVDEAAVCIDPEPEGETEFREEFGSASPAMVLRHHREAILKDLHDLEERKAREACDE